VTFSVAPPVVRGALVSFGGGGVGMLDLVRIRLGLCRWAGKYKREDA
jgi:hypothetical protein